MSKSTAHGRRHDSVMYLNHHVKKKNFLNIVNVSRANRGLPTIKSATTAWNRSRPKNMRSLQAKNHIGLGLFCCKKPPKAEDQDNLLVHFCRVQKKNIIRALSAKIDTCKMCFTGVLTIKPICVQEQVQVWQVQDHKEFFNQMMLN